MLEIRMINFFTTYLFGILSLWNIVLCRDISLTMVGSPTENSSLTLTCTYSGADSVQLVSWFTVVGAVGGVDDSLEGDVLSTGCAAFSVTADATLYEYACSSANIYTWTIKSIQSTNDNQQWACAIDQTNGDPTIYSSAITITLQNQTTEGLTTITATDKTTTSPTTNKPDPKVPVIIGCAAGGVVLIAVGIAVILYLRRRTNKKKLEQMAMKNNSQTSTN